MNCSFSVHLSLSPAGEAPNTLWVINAAVIKTAALWHQGLLVLNCYTVRAAHGVSSSECMTCQCLSYGLF